MHGQQPREEQPCNPYAARLRLPTTLKVSTQSIGRIASCFNRKIAEAACPNRQQLYSQRLGISCDFLVCTSWLFHMKMSV